MQVNYKSFSHRKLGGQAKKMFLTVAVFLLAWTGASAQYCTVTNSTNTLYWIENFSTTGATVNISNLGTGLGLVPGYSDYTSDTLIVTPTTSFNFSLDAQSGASPGVSIWIDWNQDTIFDASELVYDSNAGSTSALNNYTGSITVPVSALIGNTRMRIRNYNPRTPCGSQSYGEAEDYTVRVMALSPCSGTPTAGTMPTNFGACLYDGFNVVATGYTIAGGITYQWQSKPDTSSTWTNIIGMTNPTLNYPAGIFDQNTDFRMYVTCTNSSLADTSAAVTVTVNPVTACYCGVSTQYTTYYVKNITSVGALSNITYSATAQPAGSYDDRTTDTLKTYETQAFSINTEFSTASHGTNIWIDWNQDGTFDATEKTHQQGTVANQTFTYTVPAGTPVGNYRMRVRGQYSATADPSSCGSVNYGSTVDFILKVGTPPSCLAPTNLTVSNINDSTSTIGWQANGPATTWQIEYGPQGFTHGTGLDTVTTNNPAIISIVAASSYDVYVRAICGPNPGDTTSWSAPISFQNTYCTFATQTSTTPRYIDDVETQGGAVNISNPGSGPGTAYAGYSDFTNKVLIAYQGQAITTTTTMSTTGTFGYAIYIDWNNNFVFDPSEKVYANGTYGSNPLVGSFTIPTGQANGDYRMRIVGDYNSTTPGACSGSMSGDAEDYTVKIVSIPTCLPVTNLVADSLSNDAALITWNAGSASQTSWTIEWGTPGFTPGTNTGIDSMTVSDSSYLITNLVSDSTYDVYVKGDCGGGFISYWNTTTFRTECNPFAAMTYCNSFDAIQDLHCWSVIDNNNDGDTWVWYSGAIRIHTDFNAGNNDDYLITPKMQLTGNEVLKFSYKAQSTSEPSDLEVLISTTGKNAGNFTDTILSYFTFNNTAYLDTVVDLSAYTGDVYIAFHIPNGGLDGYYTYIDNVCFDICTPVAGTPGAVNVCSSGSPIDLDTVITSPYSVGTWVFSANPVAVNGSILNATTLAAGTYQAKYVVYGGCTNDTTIATVHVSAPSSAGVGLTQTVCKNAKVNLLDLLSGNADLGGHWLDFTQQPVTGNTVTAPNLQGSYNYFYITSNGICAPDTAIVVLTVDPTCDASVGVNDTQLDNVNVYPNPTSSQLNISNPANLSDLRGELTDLNGRLVMSIDKSMGTKTTISIENLQKGVYMLRIYGNEGQRTFKVVKE